MMGSKNQRASALRDIAAPSSDAADRRDEEARERAIERDAGIEEEVAADGVVIDAREHIAQRRQHERRHRAAAREDFPGRAERENRRSLHEDRRSPCQRPADGGAAVHCRHRIARRTTAW